MAPPEKGKRKLIGIALAMVLICVVGGVLGYLRYRTTHVITDDAFIDGDIYSISSQIPGKVAEVLVSSNQQVEAGDVLVKLDRSDIEADLLTAGHNLEVVRNQVAGQHTAIEVVKSQAAALNAQKSLLDKEKERVTNLLSKNNIARDDYDRVLAQWEAVNAQISAADNQRKQIETTLGGKDPEGNESAIRLAQAQVDKVKLLLEHTVIKAPVAGYVTRKNVTVGQVVSPGQPLMSLAPLSGLFITANYKETDLTRVALGQRVDFEVDTYPGVKFQGEVESIMAGTGAVFSLLPPENATGNFIKVVQRVPVRIKIIDGNIKDHPLRLGMSVVPVILVKE